MDIKKCSLKQHLEIEAISYCQQCDIYMCSKCEKNHSELCQKHIPYSLIKENKEKFTGICKYENHSVKLEYFCKNHNQLCCSACITKIKGKGKGQHTDCDVYFIEDIEKEKKNKLKDNSESSVNLSNTIENSIKELKKIFNIINDDKEKLKFQIQKQFTKIKSALNEREDKLLSEVDEKFDERFFKEELVKEGEKLPKRIKESIEKGYLIDKEWNEKKGDKLNFLINDSINIEKDVKDINNINKNI